MRIYSKTLCSFLIVLFAILSTSFDHFNLHCQPVKEGTFHFYQDNGKYHAIIYRKDSLQTEINKKIKDTSYWRVAWLSDCEFTTKYISGSEVMPQQKLDFLKQSLLTFKVTGLTKQYYTFDATLMYNDISRKWSDTMWLHQRK